MIVIAGKVQKYRGRDSCRNHGHKPECTRSAETSLFASAHIRVISWGSSTFGGNLILKAFNFWGSSIHSTGPYFSHPRSRCHEYTAIAMPTTPCGRPATRCSHLQRLGGCAWLARNGLKRSHKRSLQIFSVLCDFRTSFPSSPLIFERGTSKPAPVIEGGIRADGKVTGRACNQCSGLLSWICW